MSSQSNHVDKKSYHGKLTCRHCLAPNLHFLPHFKHLWKSQKVNSDSRHDHHLHLITFRWDEKKPPGAEENFWEQVILFCPPLLLPLEGAPAPCQ